MNLTKAISTTDSLAIIREGGQVEPLLKTIPFIVLIERGDTVQEIADYWRNSSIEYIHNKIMNWKGK